MALKTSRRQKKNTTTNTMTNNHRKLTIIETQLQAAVCTEAAPQQLCCCGKLYFAAGLNSKLPLEDIAKLRIAEMETPDRIKGVVEDCIMAGEFNGTVIVHGCQCEAASQVGNFLWGHRATIARFLRGMVAAVSRDSETLLAVLPASEQL